VREDSDDARRLVLTGRIRELDRFLSGEFTEAAEGRLEEETS